MPIRPSRSVMRESIIRGHPGTPLFKMSDDETNDPLKRWLKTVSNTYIWMGRYNHSLSLDATIMVSKNCSIIGEDVGIIFVTQYVTIATV